MEEFLASLSTTINTRGMDLIDLLHKYLCQMIKVIHNWTQVFDCAD